jgi:hypothetical protein
VVPIWSIAADSCANLQAPWCTHKLLILLGFWYPVVLGRRPEGPLERTFHLVRGAASFGIANSRFRLSVRRPVPVR